MWLARLFAAMATGVVTFACAQDVAEINKYFELDATPRAKLDAHSDAVMTGRVPVETYEVCSVAWANSKLAELNRQLNTGNAIAAVGSGRRLAEQAAGCALELGGKDRFGQLSKPAFWASIAGQGLYVGLMQVEGTDVNPKTVDRALGYLSFASQAGQPNLQGYVEKLNKLKVASQPGKTPDKPEFSGHAKDIVKELYANNLAFWIKYRGKAIGVTGDVLYVGGTEQRALIRLDGRPKGVSLDDASTAHFVNCAIADSAQILKASQLKKGQKARVLGVATKGDMGQIEIKDCSIL